MLFVRWSIDGAWLEGFLHAACIVALMDRLIHRAEIIELEDGRYRLKVAKELNAARTKKRRANKR